MTPSIRDALVRLRTAVVNALGGASGYINGVYFDEALMEAEAAILSLEIDEHASGREHSQATPCPVVEKQVRAMREKRDDGTRELTAEEVLEMSEGCLALVKESCEACGEDMSATPPMNYGDAVVSVAAKFQRKTELAVEACEKAEAELAALKQAHTFAISWAEHVLEDEQYGQLRQILERPDQFVECCDCTCPRHIDECSCLDPDCKYHEESREEYERGLPGPEVSRDRMRP